LFVPQRIFLTKGVGRSRDRLTSFELALRDAGIAHCNIVTTSSIFPPNAKLISREEGLKHLKPGQILFCVVSRVDTNEPNRVITTSISIAIPRDKEMHGYIAEYHSYGVTNEKASEYTEDLAASMLASTLGLEFDPKKSWNERKQEWLTSGKILETVSIAQSAKGEKENEWVTCVTAAVMLP